MRVAGSVRVKNGGPVTARLMVRIPSQLERLEPGMAVCVSSRLEGVSLCTQLCVCVIQCTSIHSTIELISPLRKLRLPKKAGKTQVIPFLSNFFTESLGGI